MIVSSAALAVVFGVTFLVLAALSLYFWQRRNWDGGTYFFLLLVAGAVWAFFSTLEMATTGLPLKLIFARLSYAGIVSTMPFWFLFALAYSQHGRWISRRMVPLLWAVPAGILGLAVTNEWHGLMWTSVALSPGGPGAVLVYVPGPGEWALMAYSYVLTIAGVWLLLNFALSTYRQYFSQTITLIAGALVPLAVNALFAAGFDLIVPVDPTPVAIAAMGLIYAWSTRRYRLFDIVPVARERLITDMAEGILVVDGKGRVIDVNPAARQMIGIDIAPGLPAAKILERWPDLEGRVRGMGSEPREVYLDGPGGGRWLEIRATPIRDGHGRDTGRLVTMLDISRRKAAVAALRQSEDMFRSVIEQATEGFVLADETGRIVEYNRAAGSIYGYAHDEVVGMMLWDLVYTLMTPEAQKAVPMAALRTSIERYLVTGQRSEAMKGGMESVAQCKDGSQHYIQTFDFPVRTARGFMIGNIVTDITERKRAGDALRESEERFRLCAAAAKFGTFDWDVVSDRHVWSPETYAIYGVAPGTPLTMEYIMSFIYPGDRQDDAFRAAQDPDGPGEYAMEYRIIRGSDRAVRWIYVNGRVFFAGRGAGRRAVRILAAIQDITDRKQAEGQIMSSLKEKEVLLKEIHHRVKNNMQIISSLMSLQMSDEIRPEVLAAFQESRDRIRSMALIHEKLYMSSDLSHVDFRDYVESLVSALRRTYAPTADIRFDMEITNVSLSIDSAIPCGLIINELVTNSLKHAYKDERGGTVRVAMTAGDGGYTLTVGDDGPGLPAGMDLWKAPSLGLRLVVALVGQLNGRIELLPGPGTTFAIRFRER